MRQWLDSPFIRDTLEFIAVSHAVATGCGAGFGQLPTSFAFRAVVERGPEAGAPGFDKVAHPVGAGGMLIVTGDVARSSGFSCNREKHEQRNVLCSDLDVAQLPPIVERLPSLVTNFPHASSGSRRY